MHTQHARVEREDITLFIAAAMVGTDQREFYDNANEQALSADFLHAYIQHNYRTLYASSLALGIDHHHQARIVTALLRKRAKTAEQRTLETRLIRRSLQRLPPQRVLRLFAGLHKAGVANRRARAALRTWLSDNHRLSLHAVKYRSLMRRALRHAHLRLPGELDAFVFRGPTAAKRWTDPLLDAVRRSRFEERALYELPYTVAEGLAAARGVPRKRFLQRIAPRLTHAERQRIDRILAQHRVDAPADLSRWSVTRIASYALALREEQRVPWCGRLMGGLQAAARRSLAERPVTFTGRIAAVLDRSHSMRGSASKRSRPLAVAIGVAAMLRAWAGEAQIVWTPSTGAPLAAPSGHTDLARAVIAALRTQPDLVVIVSDGVESVAGATEAVVRTWRRDLDPTGRVSFLHLNPVFDAAELQPRALGKSIPVGGLRRAEDFGPMLTFLRFASGLTGRSALQRYVDGRVAAYLA